MREQKLGPLKVWQHPPIQPMRARCLMLHGMGEHSGRHLQTANALVKQGIEAVRFDFRGEGQSDGERMWVESFQDYVDDVRNVMNWIKSDLPSAPLFLFGHSLGGAVALHACPSNQTALRGLALSAPAYRPGNAISPFKIKIAKTLSRWFPHLRIPDAVDVTGLSRDQQVGIDFKKDPLNCSFNTLRQGNEILKAVDQIPDLCKTIEIPTLIAHGSADPLVLLSGSQEILGLLKTKDKTLEAFPDARHELHNELCRESFFESLSQWILRHA